ncbi:hypothetical protein K470DRAFT_242662 [Piedraia hortae CBS 480.64]|uniref:Endosomal peripheral membrane protein n=1 Tax=Piedraia hortae CBS 480.64 TaxID=1314780 RepID=A0A6A7C5G0_9PEZI|nr:hypothetical protein K470DRAFT_242662 [Piedraia hortae CBS 480.64]
MSSALLTNELNTLVSESKRRNPELKSAAERSLQELTCLPSTSEQQVAADLSRRPAFIDPFLLACGTRNVKLTNSGASCLQKLAASRALPRSRLKEALDAFNICAELGVELQLKALQALPSLVQNYADELRAELLASALQLCATLQNSKTQTVSGVAAATLQQLVAVVFERVAAEDRKSNGPPVPAEDEQAQSSRPAAHDAYNVFRDLVWNAEGMRSKSVHLSSLSPEASLELITSCLQGSSKLFASHQELTAIIRTDLLPLVTRVLSENFSYPITVRCVRVTDCIITRHFSHLTKECEPILGLLTQISDTDPLSWKRVLAMEVIRNFFATGSLVVDAFAAFDETQKGKGVIQHLMASFVRLSAEKPSVIGLSQQSSAPIGPQEDTSSDQAVMEAAGGVAGVIGSGLGPTETNIPGISPQWSLPRTAGLDQLDKKDPPAFPMTYVYTLVLECLNHLSDSLAKVILPLAVQHGGSNSDGRPEFSKGAIPLNPLEAEESPALTRARSVAALVECCWPAVLATSSTFLNAALEEQYYRNLIKSFQRFAQVAGLLRLTTPRDALMTTLSKSAVPPHVFNAATGDCSKTPIADGRNFSSPKSLLSMDNLVSPISPNLNSSELIRPILTTRNLLCLRALLNLAIALGPTLGRAVDMVVDVLRQADMLLSHSGTRPVSSSSIKGFDSAASVRAFSTEVGAVEAAASRLFESTSGYPNEALLYMLKAFVRIINGRVMEEGSVAGSAPSTPRHKGRTLSGLPGSAALAEVQLRDYKFALPRLGRLAQLNMARLTGSDPAESGWDYLVKELLSVVKEESRPQEARQVATTVLCKVASEAILEVSEDDEEIRSTVQPRSMAVLLQLIGDLYSEEERPTNEDLSIHAQVLEALKALILESCGESLIAGWDKVVSVLSSAFEQTGSIWETNWHVITSDIISPGVGRIAFAGLQLVCSDFLASLPTSAMPGVVELLYRFMKQTDAVNAALTTVTMAWNVADFLLESSSKEDIEEVVVSVKSAKNKVGKVELLAATSRPAQLFLILARMQEAIEGTQKEVRNAVFHTICSIFRTHGDQFTSEAWEFLLRHVLIRIAADDAESYPDADEETSMVIISGIFGIMAQHLGAIEQNDHLAQLWKALLEPMETYISCESYAISAAVYDSLAKLLSQIGDESTIWKQPASSTVSLWLKGVPKHASGRGDNQQTYLVYVETGAQLYRLTKQSMTLEQAIAFMDNLYFCLWDSDGPLNGVDVKSPSPLQSKALELLKSIRTDLPGLCSHLIIIAAKLVTLHHDTLSKNSPRGPTFVALSRLGLQWLKSLVETHINNEEILTPTGGNPRSALITGIQSLKTLTLDQNTKSQALRREAITTSEFLAQIIFPTVSDTAPLSAEYVGIISGILNVNLTQTTHTDQLKDIESFTKLRDILIPHLSTSQEAYSRAIYLASLIHLKEPTLLSSPLSEILTPRCGRISPPNVTHREKLAYVCFHELIRLSSADSALSESTAPYLTLRLAIPLKAYIADQPLRGKKPIPLSELEELRFGLGVVGRLVGDTHTSADLPADSPAGALVRKYIFPLLADAVAVAGDHWMGSMEVLGPLEGVVRGVMRRG